MAGSFFAVSYYEADLIKKPGICIQGIVIKANILEPTSSF